MDGRLVLALGLSLGPLLAGADTLDIYQELTGKTVLMSSRVAAPPYPMVADTLKDKTNAIATIERALAEKGIELVQDGPYFVRLFPKSERNFTTNAPLRGAELASPMGLESSSKGAEAVGPGMIDFSGADLNQVLEIYADMKRRTVLRPITLPASIIRLRTWGHLTRKEMIYAVETVLALNNILVVDDGAKFVQALPLWQRAQPRAPKPEPGAKLIDPRKVPAVGFSVQTAPSNEVERLEQELERLRAALCEFLHTSSPNKGSARRLLELYARLTYKTAVASTNFDRFPIYFSLKTPVTKDELLYAIETTFRLNDLAIVPVDDRRIRLGPLRELRQRNGNRVERGQPK